MSEWQLIETAPKDRPILGYAEGTQTTVEWRPGRLGDGYWSLCVPGAYAEDSEWVPTHWKLLDAPPNVKGERQKDR